MFLTETSPLVLLIAVLLPFLGFVQGRVFPAAQHGGSLAIVPFAAVSMAEALLVWLLVTRSETGAATVGMLLSSAALAGSLLLRRRA